MYSQVSLLAVVPVRLLKTSFMGIETEPKLMFNSNANSKAKVKMVNKRVFRFLFCKLGFFEVSSVRVEQRFAIENLCEVSRTLRMKGFSIHHAKKRDPRSDELNLLFFLLY